MWSTLYMEHEQLKQKYKECYGEIFMFKHFIGHASSWLNETFHTFTDDNVKMREQVIREDTTVRLVETSDVRIDKNLLSSCNLAARTPNILTRHLFKALFSFEELATRSLFGKKSNARPDSVLLPSLDPNRRNAIFGKVKVI